MNNFYNCPAYLINGQHRITINVVGAGGTGSLIVTKLARLNKALVNLGHPGLFVKLIDYDKIEEMNVGRQMFTNNDVGRFKAECLMSKINLAFNLDWDSDCAAYSLVHSKVNIIFNCVDNIKSRELIFDSFYNKESTWNELYEKHLMIDCGNSRSSGQVIISDVDRKLKNISDLVPNWKNQDTVELQGEGCSYADKLKEQSLFVNDWVSLHAVNLIEKLILNKRINHQGVFFNIDECLSQKIKVDYGKA